MFYGLSKTVRAECFFEKVLYYVRVIIPENVQQCNLSSRKMRSNNMVIPENAKQQHGHTGKCEATTWSSRKMRSICPGSQQRTLKIPDTPSAFRDDKP
jgi:hypothetical protein